MRKDWFVALPKVKNVTIGQQVICNGYRGTICRVLTGQLDGTVEVRLQSGEVCVPIDDLREPLGRNGAAFNMSVQTQPDEAEPPYCGHCGTALNEDGTCPAAHYDY
jgi:hypothetical protein